MVGGTGSRTNDMVAANLEDGPGPLVLPLPLIIDRCSAEGKEEALAVNILWGAKEPKEKSTDNPGPRKVTHGVDCQLLPQCCGHTENHSDASRKQSAGTTKAR